MSIDLRLLPVLGFIGCLLYGLICWAAVARNRDSVEQSWIPVLGTGETLTVRGRQYLKRFYWALGCGLVFFIMIILAYSTP